jgi:hypothetical protein
MLSPLLVDDEFFFDDGAVGVGEPSRTVAVGSFNPTVFWGEPDFDDWVAAAVEADNGASCAGVILANVAAVGADGYCVTDGSFTGWDGDEHFLFFFFLLGGCAGDGFPLAIGCPAETGLFVKFFKYRSDFCFGGLLAHFCSLVGSGCFFHH